MVNLIILIAYCVLMVIFLLMSVLTLRHTMKFGYIDPRFKTLGWIFGFVVLAIILVTVYLVTSLFNENPTGGTAPKTTTNINY
ncbi:hypothetical protein HZA44_00965 [Candidatus Peregrinibacteria bacterium]|nr:hypothetical protein [Candidatus Peregrinibacteria bacterium]